MNPLCVTLLGTGTPNPNPERAGASYLFQAGDFKFMSDCGPGALLRLGQSGVSADEIDHLFFTHFHLDHYADFGQFVTNRWIKGNHRPLKIFGPTGLKELVDLVMASHFRDFGYRQKIRKSETALPVTEVTEVEEGFVFEQDGLTVSPFNVSHFPIEQPLGYRVQSAKRKIVFSGDTSPNENVIRHAQNADVLIHECIEYEKWTAPDILEGHIELAHTSPDFLGQVAAEAKTRLCVTTHMLSSSRPKDLHRKISNKYDGPVVIGQDLMTV